MEFAGTFLLVCTASFRPVPAAVCGTLACIIYMGVDISGAHYNPAVTLTFYLRGRCTLPDMVAYIPMQLLGGIAGACVGRTVSGVSEIRFVPGVGYSFGQAMYAEVLFTFALCYSILTIALRHDAVLNPAFGRKYHAVVFLNINISFILFSFRTRACSDYLYPYPFIPAVPNRELYLDSKDNSSITSLDSKRQAVSAI